MIRDLGGETLTDLEIRTYVEADPQNDAQHAQHQDCHSIYSLSGFGEQEHDARSTRAT